MASIKSLTIGLLLMSGIMLGGLTLLGDGINIYNANDTLNDTSNQYSRIISYLEQINSTAYQWENTTMGEGALSNVGTTWIGIIFNNLGQLVKQFTNLNKLFMATISDFSNNPYGSFIPSWFISIIITIISVIIILLVVSFIINRGNNQI